MKWFIINIANCPLFPFSYPLVIACSFDVNRNLMIKTKKTKKSPHTFATTVVKWFTVKITNFLFHEKQRQTCLQFFTENCDFFTFECSIFNNKIQETKHSYWWNGLQLTSQISHLRSLYFCLMKINQNAVFFIFIKSWITIKKGFVEISLTKIKLIRFNLRATVFHIRNRFETCKKLRSCSECWWGHNG